MAKQQTVLDLMWPNRRRSVVTIPLLLLTWAFTFRLLADDGLQPLRSADSPERLPVARLSCTDSFWDPDACGIDGVHCTPPANRLFAFQCPSNCLRQGVVTGKPHLAGDQEVLDQPLVIGGPIYRGDSYICPAALHAGAVADDRTGGCAVAKFMGMTNSFPGSFFNDIETLDVQTYFPSTFRFTIESDDLDCPPERHTRWLLPYLSAAHTYFVWRATTASTVRSLWALAVICAHLSLKRDDALSTTIAPGLRPPIASSASSSSSSSGYDPKAPVPRMLDPVINMDTISNITFQWATPVPYGVDGISMLVDDVERARRYFDDNGGHYRTELRDWEPKDEKVFFWQRTPQAFRDYIRFGYVKDGKVLKYSKAGSWLTNGTWTGIPETP